MLDIHINVGWQMERAEPNGVITLAKALSLTLLYNPELKAFSHAIRAADARQLQAGLRVNPELDVEVENFGGADEFAGFKGAQTTIQLSQLIELGGKADKRKAVSGYDARLARTAYRGKRLDVAGEMSRTFMELLYIQEKEALSRELIAVSRQIRDSVDKRVQAGKDSPVELAKARIGLARSELEHLDIIKYKDAVRKRLASYWDSRNPVFSGAAGRLDEIDAVPELAAVQALLRENPEVLQRAVEIRKRQAEMALARSGAIPNIRVGGGVKHFNNGDNTAYVVGFSLPLPVIDRNQGGRREALQNLQKARAQEKTTTLEVWNQINRLHADLATARQKAVLLSERVLTSSTEMFEAARTSYRQGKMNYLELLDAQRTYFKANNDYIDVLAAYQWYKTDLERLIGRDLQAINETKK